MTCVYVHSNIYLAFLACYTITDELLKLQSPEIYDPASKFSLIYDAVIENTRYFTKRADLDITGDETTYGNAGCGKYISNLKGKIVSRGGQSTLMMSKRNRLYGAIHRHKSNPKCEGTWPAGPSEIRHLVEKYVADYVGDGDDCLWSEKPHIVADNYFTHELLLDWLGKHGYGYLGTAARNQLIKGMNTSYFHKEKMTVNRVNKAARFTKPIVFSKLKKSVKGNLYRRVHVSFQSTGATNIATVNSITNGRLYGRKKCRGRGVKHVRIIEMNMVSNNMFCFNYASLYCVCFSRYHGFTFQPRQETSTYIFMVQLTQLTQLLRKQASTFVLGDTIIDQSTMEKE